MGKVYRLSDEQKAKFAQGYYSMDSITMTYYQDSAFFWQNKYRMDRVDSYLSEWIRYPDSGVPDIYESLKVSFTMADNKGWLAMYVSTLEESYLSIEVGNSPNIYIPLNSVKLTDEDQLLDGYSTPFMDLLNFEVVYNTNSGFKRISSLDKKYVWEFSN